MKSTYKILCLTTFLLTSFSAYAMKGKGSGELSLSTNFRAISDGVSSVLSDPSTVASSAILVGWHSVTNNAKSGIFDSNAVRDPQVIYSLAGGIIGKTIKSTITKESYNKLYSPFKLILSHPFLSTYVGLHCYFRFNEIKNNPGPCIAEAALLGVHFFCKKPRLLILITHFIKSIASAKTKSVF